jgi:hypothetical protein
MGAPEANIMLEEHTFQARERVTRWITCQDDVEGTSGEQKELQQVHGLVRMEGLPSGHLPRLLHLALQRQCRFGIISKSRRADIDPRAYARMIEVIANDRLGRKGGQTGLSVVI